MEFLLYLIEILFSKRDFFYYDNVVYIDLKFIVECWRLYLFLKVVIFIIW